MTMKRDNLAWRAVRLLPLILGLSAGPGRGQDAATIKSVAEQGHEKAGEMLANQGREEPAGMRGEKAMSTVLSKGNPVEIAGRLPQVGTVAPPFTLTGADLSDVPLAKFAGKKKILNIVISLDTGTCALSASRFNEDVSKLSGTVLINISADLPFAQKRFCESHSLTNIVTLSTMRGTPFGKDYGVQIMSGPLAGLLSRAVVVLDETNRVTYTEQVAEMSHEPNYEAALRAVKSPR